MSEEKKLAPTDVGGYTPSRRGRTKVSCRTASDLPTESALMGIHVGQPRLGWHCRFDQRPRLLSPRGADRSKRATFWPQARSPLSIGGRFGSGAATTRLALGRWAPNWLLSWSHYHDWQLSASGSLARQCQARATPAPAPVRHRLRVRGQEPDCWCARDCSGSSEFGRSRRVVCA